MSKMKRVTIPMDDNLVKLALINAEQNINALMENGCLGDEAKDNLSYAHFDYLGLIGIFSGDYKVTIEISQDDFDSFSHKHGVDFPAFIDLEVVDVKEEIQEDEPQYFEHIAYIEDDMLSFAIRSDKHFPNADDEGADPEDSNSTRFHLYKQAKIGEAIFFEGTTFLAAPTKKGWSIIKNGKIIERVMIK
jgi:hypothetical protein